MTERPNPKVTTTTIGDSAGDLPQFHGGAAFGSEFQPSPPPIETPFTPSTRRSTTVDPDRPSPSALGFDSERTQSNNAHPPQPLLPPVVSEIVNDVQQMKATLASLVSRIMGAPTTPSDLGGVPPPPPPGEIPVHAQPISATNNNHPKTHPQDDRHLRGKYVPKVNRGGEGSRTSEFGRIGRSYRQAMDDIHIEEVEWEERHSVTKSNSAASTAAVRVDSGRVRQGDSRNKDSGWVDSGRGRTHRQIIENRGRSPERRRETPPRESERRKTGGAGGSLFVTDPVTGRQLEYVPKESSKRREDPKKGKEKERPRQGEEDPPGKKRKSPNRHKAPEESTRRRKRDGSPHVRVEHPPESLPGGQILVANPTAGAPEAVIAMWTELERMKKRMDEQQARSQLENRSTLQNQATRNPFTREVSEALMPPGSQVMQ